MCAALEACEEELRALLARLFFPKRFEVHRRRKGTLGLDRFQPELDGPLAEQSQQLPCHTVHNASYWLPSLPAPPPGRVTVPSIFLRPPGWEVARSSNAGDHTATVIRHTCGCRALHQVRSASAVTPWLPVDYGERVSI